MQLLKIVETKMNLKFEFYLLKIMDKMNLI